MMVSVLLAFATGLVLYIKYPNFVVSTITPFIDELHTLQKEADQPGHKPESVQLQGGFLPVGRENYPSRSGCTESAEAIQTVQEKVTKWVDKKGRVRYGEKAPDEVEAKEILGWAGNDYFDLHVSSRSSYVSSAVRNQIAIHGRAIYRVYQNFLGIDAMSKSDVEVRIFNDKANYANFRRKVAPGLGYAAGFYLGEQNLAVVLHQNWIPRTLSIAVHETTHVINAENFGDTPRWFDEGMAGVFEGIRVTGQLIELYPLHGWIRMLSQPGQIMSPTRLIQADRHKWRGEQRSRLYANSWALAFYLMQPQNRETMREFQKFLTADKCNADDSLAFFRQQYPGGIRALEADWRNWLALGDFSTIRY